MSDRPKELEESKQLLITVEEAARRLCIGRSHIYDQMQRGVLRSIRIGRSRRILETDLASFIDDLLETPEGRAIARLEQSGRRPVKRIPTRSGRR